MQILALRMYALILLSGIVKLADVSRENGNPTARLRDDAIQH